MPIEISLLIARARAFRRQVEYALIRRAYQTARDQRMSLRLRLALWHHWADATKCLNAALADRLLAERYRDRIRRKRRRR